MFKIILWSALMVMSNLAAANTDLAINAVKQQQKIQTLLSAHDQQHYEVGYHAMPMGGHCGFVGCQWRELVSVVITAKRANSPTMTLLAEVTGQTPHRDRPPVVRFVELTDMNDKSWTSTLIPKH